MKISILGAGAWGTALAITFAYHHKVMLWMRDPDQCEHSQKFRENTRYLPGVSFSPDLTISSDLCASLENNDLIIVTTPTEGLRSTLQAISANTLRPLPPILWACKGFEQTSSLLPHQVMQDVLPEHILYGVLSGPSFAKEVAQRLPTALVIASQDEMLARRLSRHLNTTLLRLYANQDVVGVEVGGAIKNVMAIATGISDGLQFGLNARAALMTRGLAEMTRLGVALGANPSTLMGLSGMGDLILTCTGDLSRNRQVGLQLATGKPLPLILGELGHVAEGVATAREVLAMARRFAIDMPITEAVCRLLYEQQSPQEVLQGLLSRSPKYEVDGSNA